MEGGDNDVPSVHGSEQLLQSPVWSGTEAVSSKFVICSLSVVWESTRLLSFRRVLAMSRKTRRGSTLPRAREAKGTSARSRTFPSDSYQIIIPTTYLREGEHQEIWEYFIPHGADVLSPVQNPDTSPVVCWQYTAPHAPLRRRKDVNWALLLIKHLHLSIRGPVHGTQRFDLCVPLVATLCAHIPRRFPSTHKGGGTG